MTRFSRLSACFFLVTGCAQGADEPLSPDASVEENEDCSTADASCPRSEIECQITEGLCWHWTIETIDDQRVCVRGDGICGEVLHPTDSDAFPVMCHEGCEGGAPQDGLSPWK